MKARHVLLLGVLLAVTAMAWSSAEAGGVRIGIGIGIPFPGVYGGPCYYGGYPYAYPYPYYGYPYAYPYYPYYPYRA